MTQTEKMWDPWRDLLESGNQTLVAIRDDKLWSFNRFQQVIEKLRPLFFSFTRYPRDGDYLDLVVATP